MKLQCEFRVWTDGDIENVARYTCFVTKQQISKDDYLSVKGRHVPGKTNADVTAIKFHNCEITKIPQGLKKIFPNLRSMVIAQSPNLKTITKSDLADYKNFEVLGLMGAQLEFLPGDLFEGFENLKIISFENNKLKIIEPGLLDDLDKLTRVDFSGNVNYNIDYHPLDPLYDIYPNPTLEDVLDLINNPSLRNCR